MKWYFKKVYDGLKKSYRSTGSNFYLNNKQAEKNDLKK